jgi:hypothetical protein
MPMQLVTHVHCGNAAAGTLHVQTAYMTLHNLHAVVLPLPLLQTQQSKVSVRALHR